MRLFFLAGSLGCGGAERQLLTLAKSLKRYGHDVVVSLFYIKGEYHNELKEAGIPIIPLNKQGRLKIISFLFQLLKQIHKNRPDFIYSFLGTPNIYAAILKPFISNAKIVWSIRGSNMDFRRYPLLFRISYWIECKLANSADLIIANSNAGKNFAMENGFPGKRIIVIQNGIDTEFFKPDKKSGEFLRKKWRISNKDILIGLVGRIDTMKDHQTFLRAASILIKKVKNVRFVCIGDGPHEYLNELQKLCKELNLEKLLIWAGRLSDMPAVYNSCDLIVLSSLSEGFPNVVAEAMSCDTVCVVTNVGDAALIVGETGVVVEPKDPPSLAEGMSKVISNLAGYKKLKPRKRIISNYSVETFSRNTEKALLSI